MEARSGTYSCSAYLLFCNWFTSQPMTMACEQALQPSYHEIRKRGQVWSDSQEGRSSTWLERTNMMQFEEEREG